MTESQSVRYEKIPKMEVNTELSRASKSSKGLQDTTTSPIMSCFVCDQSLNNLNDFDGHLEEHGNETPSRCLMCSKVFRFRGSLTRHLFTEHGISEKLKSSVLGSGEVGGGDLNLKHSNEESVVKEERRESEENDEDEVLRIMEGFLPNQNAKSKKNEEKQINEKLLNGVDEMDSVRSAASDQSGQIKKDSFQTTKNKGAGLVQCEVCKVLFATVNSLEIHRKLNHSTSDVESVSIAKSTLVNGDHHHRNGREKRAKRESYKNRRVDIGGPSENIVSEPDFELIKIAAAGIHHLDYDMSPADDDVSPTLKDSSRVIEWNSGVFSVGHFVDDDDDNDHEQSSICVEPVSDSGINAKYRLCPSSEEVLVTRVVGVNVNNGERAFLYKCHWCSEVFLALDKLQEHLGSHLRRSRKTFMCINCGQLFSTNSCLKEHLPQCQKDDEEEEVDDDEEEAVVKSSESLSPLDFTSTSSESGIPLPSDVGVYVSNDVKIKSEPDSEIPINVCVPCDVQIKVEPVDDSYEDVEEARKSFSSYETVETPNGLLNFEPESAMKFNALSVKTENEKIESSVVVETKQPSVIVSQTENNSPPTLLMTKDGTRVGYQCNYCPKLFDRLYSLNRHLRSHTGVKPCYCKECGKGFSEPRNLRHHIIRFHSDGSERHLLRRVRDRSNKAGKQKRVSEPPPVVSVPQNIASKPMGLVFNATCSQQLSTDATVKNCDNNRKGNSKTGFTIFDPESLTAKLFEAKPDRRRKLEDVISGGSNGIALLYPTGVSSGTTPKRNCIARNNLEETTECGFQILSDPKLSLLGNLRLQRQTRSTALNSNKAKLSNDVDLSPHLSALSSLSGAVVNRVMDSIVGNTMNSNKDVQLDEFLKNNAEKLNLLSSESGRNNAADELRTRTDFCKVEIIPNDNHPYKCIFCNYSSGTKCNLKVHMMRHRGIKNYNCNICNFCGVTQSDLNRHMKTRGHRLRTRFLRQSFVT